MSKKSKDIISVIIATIGILFFCGFIIIIWIDVFFNLSFMAIVGATFGSLIPGLLTYSIASVTIEFVKENFFSKNP